jgi:pentatricopeptide repeat protein
MRLLCSSNLIRAAFQIPRLHLPVRCLASTAHSKRKAKPIDEFDEYLIKFFGNKESNPNAMQIKAKTNFALERFYDIPIEKIPNNFLMEHMASKYGDHKVKVSGRKFRVIISTFLNIAHYAYLSKEYESALRVYAAVNERGVKVLRLVFHNIMIKIHAEEGKLDQALEVLQKIKDHGTKPDVVSFNILLQKFSELKDQASINLLLKFTKELEVQPTLVTSTILLKFAIYSKGKFTLEDVKSFLKTEESDPVLVSMLIFEALRLKDLNLAIDCYNYFKQLEIYPESSAPLNWLLAVCCMTQKRELADELFNLMVRKNIRFSATSLNFYIIANLSKDRHDKARRATQELHRLNRLAQSSTTVQ